MKKVTLTRKPILLLLIFCLPILGMAWTTGRDQVEVVPSSDFDAVGVKLIEISSRPHLQFSVTNKSGAEVSALKVTLTAYDKKGNLSGRQTWYMPAGLPNGSKMNSALAANPNLRSAARYVVEFTSLSSLQSCGTDFCRSCTEDAIRACGAGRVGSYSCTQGETCSCSFTCREGGGGRPPIQP